MPLLPKASLNSLCSKKPKWKTRATSSRQRGSVVGMVRFDSLILSRKPLNELAGAIEWVVCWLVGIEMAMSCTDYKLARSGGVTL